MKSSLGKLGRKLSMQRSDVNNHKEIKDHHQPSAYLDDLAHASKVVFFFIFLFLSVN